MLSLEIYYSWTELDFVENLTKALLSFKRVFTNYIVAVLKEHLRQNVLVLYCINYEVVS